MNDTVPEYGATGVCRDRSADVVALLPVLIVKNYNEKGDYILWTRV